MASTPLPRTRKLTVIAQDPGVTYEGKIVRAEVEVPAEELLVGPAGYRVKVVDYDSSTDTFYKPLTQGLDGDPFKEATDEQLLSDPHFHCQNVYALVMRTLARFEHAIGRRVAWGLEYGHQLNVAPHAFAEANAFYSPDDHALLFGYFPKRPPASGMVFACLSHDVVVHETTHALLDGLRKRYTDPSSPDQAAFHEGFSDVVALLSVFSLPGIVRLLIDRHVAPDGGEGIQKELLDVEALRRNGLFGLAEEMGSELSAVRGDALRSSAKLERSARYYRSDPEFVEPHRRGEILVAAVLNAFIEVWAARLKSLGEIRAGFLHRERVVEEGAEIASTLLTMAIRALDYAPPVDLQFGDYLSALLTGDVELRPDDSKYHFRDTLRRSFRDYGIRPASRRGVEEGTWEPPPRDLCYDRTHYEEMQHDPEEVFRFIWENRQKLEIDPDVFSEVLSVRPCRRVGPDGFVLHETVAEYRQVLEVLAGELEGYGLDKPADMPATQEVKIYGGGALIFDEYGRLKYHVRNRLLHRKRQKARLDYLWRYGFFRAGASAFRSFSSLHLQRATGVAVSNPEEW